MMDNILENKSCSNKVVDIYSRINPSDVLKKLQHRQITNPGDQGGVFDSLPNGELGESLIDFNGKG